LNIRIRSVVFLCDMCCSVVKVWIYEVQQAAADLFSSFLFHFIRCICTHLP
jgi:hypothetical protein